MHATFGLRDARKILKILEDQGHQARLAGGCVRDRLLGIAPKDFDIATTAHPETVCAILKQSRLKVVPTGIDHGTVTVVMPSGPIEVTTLRLDVATDGRRATIAFATEFREDAARRDFTINALYEDLQGQIHDYFGGQADLTARRLVFVGEPRARIQEDYLRILRFFRFWAKLGFGIRAEDLQIIKEEAPGLSRVSQERITSELLQILGMPNPSTVLSGMAQTGVLSQVLGSAQPLPMETAILGIEHLPERLWAIGRLGLLAADVVTPAAVQAFAKQLKLTNDQAATLQIWLALWAEVSVLQMPIDRLAGMNVLDRAEIPQHLRVEDSLLYWQYARPELRPQLAALTQVEADYGRLRRESRDRLPVTGYDLIKHCSLKPGPELGQTLAALRDSYRLGLWQSREEGLRWLSASGSK